MVVSIDAEAKMIVMYCVFQFAGFYPFDEAKYNIFEQSIERLALNDTGVRLVPTSNPGKILDRCLFVLYLVSVHSIRQRHANWILGQSTVMSRFAHRLFF